MFFKSINSGHDYSKSNIEGNQEDFIYRNLFNGDMIFLVDVHGKDVTIEEAEEVLLRKDGEKTIMVTANITFHQVVEQAYRQGYFFNFGKTIFDRVYFQAMESS